MRLLPLKSSMIASVGYDPALEAMVVQFNSGKIYRYDGVPSDAFVAVVTAKGSVGKMFNFHIKNKAYPFRQLKPDEVQNL